MVTQIFNKLKMRWLTVIVLITIIASILYVEALKYIGGFETIDEIFAAIGKIALYAVPIIWIGLICEKNNVHVRDLIFQKTETRWPRWRELIAIIMAHMILSIGAFGVIFLLLSYVAPSFIIATLEAMQINAASNSAFPLVVTILGAVTSVLIAPIAEELIFRGILFNRFLTKWGLKTAIIVPSIIFGILHYDLIGKFAFGIIVTLLAIRTGNLVIPT